MKYQWNTLIYTCRNIFIETRRYAGHSKWKNIKATKEAQDGEKSAIFRSLAFKMKAVIKETGNSDPTNNVKLAQLIDQAKKANMPKSTLKSILEKLQNTKKNGTTYVISVRILKEVMLILYIVTDNIMQQKLQITSILKKFNGKIMDSSALFNLFDCTSFIIASKNCNLDQAMEDAIIANAEEVEEIKYENNECFKFRGEFLQPEKIITQLENLGYTIHSIKNECTPNTRVQILEKDIEIIKKCKEKLLTEIKEIEKIEDNILIS
ncbi:probable transcriptional regulatory protein BLi02909/BL01150 [Apis laboriosa]|uniref:probable transcriptional regulatory protein BLi02909/BL01150 n=1 Tax=Apis laboriosa TaxID=183418 RepID=UPI001CC5F8C6|nr:probable transcriptional regulatory protein BLi02909/BL01150 [Apis laboriosa]